MIKRLERTFITVIMAVFTLMLCAVFICVLHFTRANMTNDSVRMMQTAAMEPMGINVRPFDDNRPPSRLPCFSLYYDINGKLIVSGTSEYYDLSDHTFLSEVMQEALALRADSITGTINQYELRFLKVNTPHGQRIVFADISSEMRTMEQLYKTCLLIGVLALAFFFPVSVFLAKLTVKPVKSAWEQQRQFIADASHELKTPLTVIFTNAELLQDISCSNTDKNRFADNILVMSKQMRGLVENLLELARLDNKAANPPFEDIDLSRCISDMLLPFEPLFFENELELLSRIESDIRIKANAQQIKQAVEAVLDNALKYSDKNGRVQLELRKASKNHCLIIVSNQGPALSKEELSSLFKRFYRADKSRTMSRSYGLGLSIAQSIVLEHKGKIWAQSENGMNSFFIQLPTI